MSGHRRGGRAFASTLRGRRLTLTRRDHLAVLVLVVALAAAGLVALLSSHGGHRVATPPTPRPPASGTAPQATSPAASSTSSPAPRCPAARAPAGSGSSTPQRICIPALRVDTTVMSLGLNSDRTVQVPPLSRVGEAGWYRYSAVPGNVGPTVILGHIDSAQYGEGVFFKLARLTSGDVVDVLRGDGRVAVFRIDRVQEISKKSFPTDAVYGPTSGPALRLVTCGGAFDSATGNYLDNIIAYGTLLSLSAAR